jgi:hypothetical protein
VPGILEHLEQSKHTLDHFVEHLDYSGMFGTFIEFFQSPCGHSEKIPGNSLAPTPNRQILCLRVMCQGRCQPKVNACFNSICVFWSSNMQTHLSVKHPNKVLDSKLKKAIEVRLEEYWHLSLGLKGKGKGKGKEMEK